jgi:hypothetical protein
LALGAAMLALVPCCWCQSSAAATAKPGAAKGSVVDPNGAPVVRARIFIAQALPAAMARPAGPPVLTGPQMTTTMSDNTGAFVVPSLPPGNYVACAEPLTPGLLDPCQWGTSAPEFTVTSGQTTTGVQIEVARGAVIPIHINDPQQLLQPVLGGRTDPNLRIHLVTARGFHYEAPIVAQAAGGRDHAATVPYGAAFSLLVLTPRLTVSDATGKPAVSASAVTAVTAGAAPSTVVYTITGVNP